MGRFMECRRWGWGWGLDLALALAEKSVFELDCMLSAHVYINICVLNHVSSQFFIHSSIHPFLQSSIPPFIHPFIVHPSIHSFIHPFIQLSNHPLIGSSICPLSVYAFIQSPTNHACCKHVFIYSIIHLFNSFIYLLFGSLDSSSSQLVKRGRLNAWELFCAMGEVSVAKLPVGSRCSLLVNLEQMDQHCFRGSEIPYGTTVAFQHEGWLDEVVTLYDVVKSDKQYQNAIWLTLDSNSSILGHQHPQSNDFRFTHDVCCGLGGFSSALHFLGGQAISAVDSASLAVEAYACNHPCKPFCADIRSSQTVRSMHHAQLKAGCQPLLTAGFPCQPFSRQGFQKGLQDPRGQILPAILKAAKLLHVCGILLECVPEVLSNMDIQHLLYCFALDHGFRIQQFVLHLHHVWPSKRSRWFALLVRNRLPTIRVLPFPEPLCLPTIKDLIPVWPAWPQSDEQQLQWTDLEHQVFNDPAFGNPDRRVIVSEALPMALHAWGSQLYACPCQCRNHGFSLQTLLKGGLRGVEVRSACAPFASRHIHPKELQALLGFLPFEQCPHNCRAALCLLGNAVSPLQGLWIFAQIFNTLGFHTVSAEEALAEYQAMLRLQMTLSWPPPATSTFKVVVSSSHGQWEFRVHRERKSMNSYMPKVCLSKARFRVNWAMRELMSLQMHSFNHSLMSWWRVLMPLLAHWPRFGFSSVI